MYPCLCCMADKWDYNMGNMNYENTSITIKVIGYVNRNSSSYGEICLALNKAFQLYALYRLHCQRTHIFQTFVKSCLAILQFLVSVKVFIQRSIKSKNPSLDIHQCSSSMYKDIQHECLIYPCADIFRHMGLQRV